MGLPNYADYDGLGLAELVKKRDVTPLELVEAAIERIERHNPTLNAIVEPDFERAGEAVMVNAAAVRYLRTLRQAQGGR